jgi:hypothetical protein
LTSSRSSSGLLDAHDDLLFHLLRRGAGPDHPDLRLVGLDLRKGLALHGQETHQAGEQYAEHQQVGGHRVVNPPGDQAVLGYLPPRGEALFVDRLQGHARDRVAQGRYDQALTGAQAGAQHRVVGVGMGDVSAPDVQASAGVDDVNLVSGAQAAAGDAHRVFHHPPVDTGVNEQADGQGHTEIGAAAVVGVIDLRGRIDEPGAAVDGGVDARQPALPLVLAAGHVGTQVHVRRAVIVSGVADRQPEGRQLPVVERQAHLYTIGGEYGPEGRADAHEFADIRLAAGDAAAEGEAYARALKVQSRLVQCRQCGLAASAGLGDLRLLQGQVRGVRHAAQLLLCHVGRRPSPAARRAPRRLPLPPLPAVRGGSRCLRSAAAPCPDRNVPPRRIPGRQRSPVH